MGASAAHSGIGYGRSRTTNSGYAYPASGVLTIADDVHSDQNALMRPLINAIRIETPHEGPLETWVPDDPTHFEAYLTMSIVPDSSEERWLMEHGKARGAGEQFSINVCTPSWMATRLEYEARPLFRRHLLVVDHWHWETLHTALLRLFQQTYEAPTWGELAAKLARHADYEFDDS